ncbi:hypothetical protein B7453_05335 [Pseudomonas sp. IB20]|nr:hypothetical protein B7453_05335 [Pseudomonas sp. IB20]
MKSSFWKSGHTPTLFAEFLYFDLSFMVWYLLGPLAVQIAADLHLTTQQRGLVVAKRPCGCANAVCRWSGSTGLRWAWRGPQIATFH